MIIFVVAEIMFFAALMSAHTIARATVLGGVWPPAGQPRLPVERTAFNTAILLLSGALVVLSPTAARATATKKRVPISRAPSPRESPSCCCKEWNGSRFSAKA